MIFLLSMLLTSFIGCLICYRCRRNLTLIEMLFISIFVGWGYFTSLILLYSTNFPEIELSGNVLFDLIIVSLIVFSILLVFIERRTVFHFIKSIPAIIKKAKRQRSPCAFRGLRSRYYLIIPSIFLAVVLLNILTTFFHEIDMIDPIFQWVQRGELIFLEKSVSGALNHPFGYYPLHIPILYAWAYFFDFQGIRIFFLIALIGFTFITMENVYIYSKSRYASLVFTIMIVFVQLQYTKDCYAEGITNIYFFLAVLYGLRYLQQHKITFMLLASFFMAMYAKTRGEGLLFWGLLLVVIILVSISRKTLKTTQVIYWLLPFCLFYYIPKLNLVQDSSLNVTIVIMHIKTVAKCFLDLFGNFGEIYKNEPLLSGYHANAITCIITSFFAFWDSLFFSSQKTHFYNVVYTLIEVIRRIRIELWILLVLTLWKEVRSVEILNKFTMLVVYPFMCFIILVNFMQILFHYSPNTLTALVARAPLRYGGYISICLIFFLATSNVTKKVFNTIEKNWVLACALNIPFVYVLV